MRGEKRGGRSRVRFGNAQSARLVFRHFNSTRYRVRPYGNENPTEWCLVSCSETVHDTWTARSNGRREVVGDVPVSGWW